MLKVRADLFLEFHDGKAGGWDVEKAIKEYEEVTNDNKSNDEFLSVGPLLLQLILPPLHSLSLSFVQNFVIPCFLTV